MIDHIVLLKVRSSAGETEIDRLAAVVGGLAEIDEVQSVTWGRNAGDDAASADGYTHGFVVRFGDPSGLDAYLPHPLHQRVIDAVEATTDGVLVFDIAT
jgi:hypothetical protein